MNLLMTTLKAPFIIVGYLVIWSVKVLGWGGQRLPRLFSRQQRATTHGDAKWADIPELAKRGNLSGKGFFVGVLDGKRVFTNPEASLIFYSRPGAGKSQTIGGSLRTEEENNIIVVDPAGELHKQHAEILKGKGYIVHLIDLTNPSEGWNPMSFFKHSTPSSFQHDMDTFCAEAIKSGGDERESHFIEMARNLMAGVLAAEYRYLRNSPSLHGATGILSVGGPMKRRKYFDELTKLNDPLISIAVNAFMEAGDREQGSFATTMSRKLKPWLDANVIALSQSGTWCWEDLLYSGEKHAVFIKSGVRHTPDYTSLMVGLAVATVMRDFDKTGEPLRRLLHIYADEGVLLGNSKPLVLAITQMRKMGVRVFMCFQSIRQLRTIYGRETELPGICDSMITGGMNDIQVYEDFSKIMGDRTITTKSTNKGKGGTSEGQQEAPRKLAKPEELGALGETQVVARLGPLQVLMERNFISVKHRDGTPKEVVYK